MMQSAEIPPAGPNGEGRPWYRQLNGYHWFVFAVAALGWTFDTMDQQLFTMARQPAMQELLGSEATSKAIKQYAGYATSIFIMGWAMGGLIFGILGDRFGRARMMIFTILIYSVFTGLSSLSQSFWDFALWRFLTGLGVGGEFAVGVALIAEVMPEKARPHALGWLQALSTVGNVTAALLTKAIGPGEDFNLFGSIWSGWRVMFMIGTFPALLAIVIRWRLREPERWTSVATSEQVKSQLGSLNQIFGDPQLRRNAFIGLALAISGVIGLWGVVFFIFDFMFELFTLQFKAQGVAEADIPGKVKHLVGNAGLMLNLGAFLGMWAFSRVTQKLGRKPTFALFFVVAIVAIASTFWLLNEQWHIYVLIPFLGFGILSLFGGYAIYFPELFPTRVRSTGVSFCYNVGRFVAAIGPFTLGLLASKVFGHLGAIAAWRYSGVSMCLFLVLGMLALPFAPETKDQPLPE